MMLLKHSSNQLFIISITQMLTSWVLCVLFRFRLHLKQVASKGSSATASLILTEIRRRQSSRTETRICDGYDFIYDRATCLKAN